MISCSAARLKSPLDCCQGKSAWNGYGKRTISCSARVQSSNVVVDAAWDGDAMKPGSDSGSESSLSGVLPGVNPSGGSS